MSSVYLQRQRSYHGVSPLCMQLQCRGCSPKPVQPESAKQVPSQAAGKPAALEAAQPEASGAEATKPRAPTKRGTAEMLNAKLCSRALHVSTAIIELSAHTTAAEVVCVQLNSWVRLPDLCCAVPAPLDQQCPPWVCIPQNA